MLIRDWKFEIVRATPADSADIRRLFENIRYDAAIDLQFRRGNDPYRSFQEEDDGAVVLLLKETPTEMVRPSCCRMVLRSSSAICRPLPKSLRLPVTSSQDSSTLKASTWSVYRP